MGLVDSLKRFTQPGSVNWHTVFVWLAFSGSLAFFLVNADRGFEITDEGLALVAASHPEDVRIAPTGFAYTTSILYRLAEGDPGWFRRLGALSLVACAASLAYGFGRFLPHASPVSLVPMAGLGALVYMSPGLTMPFYNHVAACGLLAGVGFFLVSGVEPRPWRARLFAVFSGAGLAMAGLAKPPGAVAVSLLLLTVGLIGVLRLRLGFWVLGGAAMVLQQLLRQGPDEFVGMLIDGVNFNRLVGEGYGPGALVSQYAREGLTLGRITLQMAAPALLAGLVAKRWVPRSRRTAPVWMSGVLLATLLAMGAWAGGHRLATQGRSAAAVLACLLVGAFAMHLSRGEEKGSRRDRIVALFLVVMPFLSLLGTNTPLGFSVLFFCGPWFLVPSAMVSGQRSQAISALMAALAMSWTLTGPYVAPYRRATPMGEQTISVQVGVTGARVRVDPATARFIRSYRADAAKCGLRAGDTVLAFSWTPGLVWAVGGRTAATTHFVHGFFAGAKQANEFALSRIPADVQERAFVIHTTRGEKVHPTLLLGRQRFPADYRLCFEAEWPVNQDVVRLYAPPRPS